jgi:NAD(P)H-dependent flavin oxidoreductase YrpB (nitropropane dioxygenase family)
MRTSLCDKLGIDVPIILAPMGDAVGPGLAAAVCNAGGLGTLPLWFESIPALRNLIRQTQSLTKKPFAVNLNLEFPQEERLDACLEAGVPVISFFWGDPSKLVSRAKAGGAIVLQTVGTSIDARAAADCGVDVIVAQGWEAGGHVRGTVSTMALLPSVVDAVGPVPVVAAGGIADGRGLAAALALGAAGVWMGTKFLASKEATIHPHFQSRVLSASENDTVYLENLFDIGWPNAPHRVLRNSTVNNWVTAGRPEIGNRPGENEVVGTSRSKGNILRYACQTPMPDFTGDIEAFSMWAGQGVGLVKKLQPAAEIVREIHDEAAAVLRRLGAVST